VLGDVKGSIPDSKRNEQGRLVCGKDVVSRGLRWVIESG